MGSIRSKEHDAIPCSVSQELVEFVANMYPEHFIDNGKINIPSVLFMLGFKIDFDRPESSYYVMPERIIRSKSRPYLTYTTTVYNGNVRQEIKSFAIESSGRYNIVYDKYNIHFLSAAYREYEVLTIDTMDMSKLVDINTIGDSRVYSEAMANLDKRAKAVDKPIEWDGSSF